VVYLKTYSICMGGLRKSFGLGPFIGALYFHHDVDSKTVRIFVTAEICIDSM
jgi:hypothetical protein